MNDRVGRYELIDRLGAGGFATVYRALDPSLDNEVAVKVLADNWSADADVRSRFIQEAQLMRRLDNRRLVQVYDIGEHEDGRPFFVMRLSDRGTLGDRLTERHHRGAPATDDELGRLVDELASCLTRVHADGIIHRDVKPSNLLIEREPGASHGASTDLLAEDEFLVLGDFGLARDTAAGVSALTIAGGSGGFAAPEQYLPTGAPDPRADLYAATAVVLYAATGQIPPLEDPVDAVLDAGRPLRPELVAALRRCMAWDRAERPATVDDWHAVMISALASEPTERVRAAETVVTQSAPARSGRGRLVGALGALAVLAVLAFVAVRALGSESGPSIVGPDRLEAGESATYSSDAERGATLSWADSEGSEGSGGEFSVAAVVPGELVIDLTVTEAGGATTSSTRRVEVVESPDGPVIVGPETVRVGEVATYTVADPDAVDVEWRDPSGTVTTDRYQVQPTAPGRFVFSAVVVRADGRRIGSTKVVEFVE